MALYQIDSKKLQQDGETKLLWYYGPEAEVRLSLLEYQISQFEVIWGDHYLLADQHSLKYGKIQSEERSSSLKPKSADLIVLDGELNLAQVSEARRFILECQGLNQEIKSMTLSYLDHRGRRPELLKSKLPLDAFTHYETSPFEKGLRKIWNFHRSLKGLVFVALSVSILIGLWFYRQSLYRPNHSGEVTSTADYQVQRWQRLCEDGDARACTRLKTDIGTDKLSLSIREDQCLAGEAQACLNLARERLRFGDSDNQARALEFLRLSCKLQDDSGCELLRERELYLELKGFCENDEVSRCLAAGQLAEKFRLYSEARKLYAKGCDLHLEANCLALGLQFIKENNLSEGLAVHRESCLRGEKTACFQLRLIQEDSQSVRASLVEQARECEQGDESACAVFTLPE